MTGTTVDGELINTTRADVTATTISILLVNKAAEGNRGAPPCQHEKMQSLTPLEERNEDRPQNRQCLLLTAGINKQPKSMCHTDL